MYKRTKKNSKNKNLFMDLPILMLNGGFWWRSG